MQLSLPVPAVALAKGAIITSTDLSTSQIPITRAFVSLVQQPAQAIGMQTLRALPAGMPISKLHLRQPPLVARGALVDFTFTRGGVRLSGQAQALEDGQAGQNIRLLNVATRATLLGVIQPNGQVILN
jgi:flagella basal body P-ring formation protein FlgA